LKRQLDRFTQQVRPTLLRLTKIRIHRRRVRSAHTGDFQGKGSTNKEICLISPAF
jgi:hypothetical protein